MMTSLENYSLHLPAMLPNFDEIYNTKRTTTQDTVAMRIMYTLARAFKDRVRLEVDLEVYLR